jgi:hypothetical protein
MEIRKVLLYTDLSYRADEQEKSLVPIVRAHIDKIDEEERVYKYHIRITHFELVQTIEEADWCILPSVWTAYVENGTISRALEFSQYAASRKKMVLVWAGGDPEWIVPISNGIQIQEGLHHALSRQVAYALERPCFVTDYIHHFYNDRWSPLPKQEKPTVGFCGMASSRLITRILFYAKNFITTARYFVNQSPVVPVIHGYPVNLRARALKLLGEHSGIKTDFIIRDRYQAGIRSKDNDEKIQDKTRKEFVQNILNNAYTVCVRGGGNFSKRFYETLACGRIPILVSTASILPFDEFIDWKKHIVWVELAELDQIGTIVENFHAKLSPQEFQSLQMDNRKLWLEMLSVEGYYSNIHRYLPIINFERKQ